MNTQGAFKTIFMLLCTIACIVILGLLLASLYLLLQVALTVLPASLVTIAVMLLAQYIYCLYRISLLMKSQIALMTAGFENKTGQWQWKLEDAKLDVYFDTGMAKFLGLIAGIISAWLFLIKLNNSGAFNKQVWWFLGQVSKVPGEIAMILASLFLLLALIMIFVKSNLSAWLKKYLGWHTDSFVSMEDKLNLEQANNLFRTAMQYYMQAKQEIQGSSSLSFMMELEQIHQALNSENLSSLVQAKKWQEFKAIAEGIILDLQRLKNAGSGKTNFWQNETEEEKAARILGVSVNATADEIKNAYRNLAMFWHPDRATGNSEKMKDVNNAYEILKNKYQFA